jgi:hypothetical protein
LLECTHIGQDCADHEHKPFLLLTNSFSSILKHQFSSQSKDEPKTLPRQQIYGYVNTGKAVIDRYTTTHKVMPPLLE